MLLYLLTCQVQCNGATASGKPSGFSRICPPVDASLVPGLCSDPLGKGTFLYGPSISAEIGETCYMQQNVFVIERLFGPSTCWFCKTLQLVDLFLRLQPENLSILKMLKGPFFSPLFTVTVVVNEPHNLQKKIFFFKASPPEI